MTDPGLEHLSGGQGGEGNTFRAGVNDGMWHVFRVSSFPSHDTFLSSLDVAGKDMWALVTFWLFRVVSSQGAKSQTHLDSFLFLHSCRSFHSTKTGVSLILLLLALVLSLWGRTCNSWFWLGWLDATARGTFGDHVNGHDTGLVPRGFVANCFASVSLPSWAGSSWLLSSLFSFKTCPLLYCIVLYTTRLRTEKTSGLIRIKFCSYV